MFGIALYNVLRKIYGVSDDDAKEAVADVANSKEVATKADLAKLERRLIEKVADAKHAMIVWMIGIGLAIVGVIKYL